MKKVSLFTVLLLFLFSLAHADRGPVIWHEGVQLSQESQKAIILHNSNEEVLILGTELKASKEIDILEFIPFPAEPTVTLAKGNPFEEAAGLVTRKGLVFELSNLEPTKGGEDKITAPVEIRFSQKVGLHDVTVIKINTIDHFARWLNDFFKTKGIRADEERLSDVYRNAQDYIAKGVNFFVFDQVKVSKSVKFVEPLIYRFKAGRIYYPLKTSNLIGGRGDVELILVLPGSISEDIWQDVWKIFPRGNDLAMMISSSAKIYQEEIGTVYPEPSFFAGREKLYIQTFKYSGPYNFKDDFTYAVAKLVPYAYRFTNPDPFHDVRFTPPLTNDERRDMREWFCTRDQKLGFLTYGNALDCQSFIPNDEYDVLAAVFREGRLPGIPRGDTVIEKNTLRKQHKKGNVDQTLVNDFNGKNSVAYPLESAFPADMKAAITIRDDKDDALALKKGRTFISRAGFNKDRTREKKVGKRVRDNKKKEKEEKIKKKKKSEKKKKKII